MGAPLLLQLSVSWMAPALSTNHLLCYVLATSFSQQVQSCKCLLWGWLANQRLCLPIILGKIANLMFPPWHFTSPRVIDFPRVVDTFFPEARLPQFDTPFSTEMALGVIDTFFPGARLRQLDTPSKLIPFFPRGPFAPIWRLSITRGVSEKNRLFKLVLFKPDISPLWPILSKLGSA